MSAFPAQVLVIAQKCPLASDVTMSCDWHMVIPNNIASVVVALVPMYRISSNKRPGAYFLQGLQDPALKRDQAFIRDPTLISYRLFRRYGGPTKFISRGAPTCSLSASSSSETPGV